MEVLKQISPVVVPLAPKEIPEKQRPSSRARIAVVGTGREVMYLLRGREHKISGKSEFGFFSSGSAVGGHLKYV
jgi:hypothetical protein